MNLSKTIPVIVIVLFTGLSCHNRGLDKPLNVETISLEYSELPILPIDSAVTNVRFVRLETNEDCLIESFDEIQIIDERIFIRSARKIQQALFVFDMEGKHLLTIDEQGRGPGEYYGIRGFAVSPAKEEIYLLDFGKVLIYDYNGTFLSSHSFVELGVLPCEDSPSFMRLNDYYYMFAMTAETAGFSPEESGWGTELMEDDMFNLVAVYDSDWQLVSRSVLSYT